MANAKYLRTGLMSQDTLFTTLTSSFAINEINDTLEFIFQIPEAATITHLGFRYSSRVGTPVQHSITLQGVDGSGLPSGVALGGGSPASGNFTPPADNTWNTTFQWIALDNSYTTTRGQYLAIVIAPVGTPDASNASTFVSVLPTGLVGFPYCINNNAGTRTRVANTPIYGLKSSTKSYGIPAHGILNTNVHSGSNPNEYAQKFNIPGEIGRTYQIIGISIAISPPTSDRTLLVSLYSDTTVLQSVVIDSEYFRLLSSSIQHLHIYFTEAELVNLNFGQDYRIGFKPLEGSPAWTMHMFPFPDSNDLTALLGGGNMFSAVSTRTGSGSWTDNTSRRMIFDFIFDDITTNRGPLVGPGRLIRS